jgi:hypothetical protein
MNLFIRKEPIMSIELKIKSKHLGLEAQVIRHEERKLKKQINWMSKRQALPPNFVNKYESIHNHRVWDVRNENRATFLARAYLAGKPYQSLEWKRKDDVVFNCYILPRVFEMVNKYGPASDRIYKYPQYNSGGKFTCMDYRKDDKNAIMDRLKEWSKV